MKRLITALALWGLADAAFMVARPNAWAKFWERGVHWIGTDRNAPKVMAGLQVAICVWMLSKLRD
jgi:hypothetical protein